MKQLFVTAALLGLSLASATKVGDAAPNFKLADSSGKVVELSKLKGQPVVLTFWATWCPPCVEELPLLDGFYKQNVANGWQVLGLAIDQPTAVRNFLVKKPLSFAIGLAGLEGTDLVKSLGNLSGALPFTVVFGQSGLPLHRKMGQVSAADLNQWKQLR